MKDNGIAYPADLDASVALTPFAAEMRYDYLPPEANGEKPFDRGGAVQLIRVSLEWAERMVSQP